MGPDSGDCALPAAATSSRPLFQAVSHIVFTAAGALGPPRLMLTMWMPFWMHQSIPAMIQENWPLPFRSSTLTA